MKKIIMICVLLGFAILTVAGCHNTGRQIRKMVDGTHDLLLEGTF